MKKGFVVVFGFPASIKQPIDVQIFAVGHNPLFKLLLRSICLWIPSFEIRPFCCILMHFAYICVFLAYCSFSRAARVLPCGSGRLSIDKVPRRLRLLLQRWRMVTWWQFSAETSCFPEIASVLVQPRSMPDWHDSLVSSKVQFRECALRKTVHAIESRITTVAAGLWSLALELLQLLMEPKYRGCQSLLKLRLEPRCSWSGSCRSRRCASGTLDTAATRPPATNLWPWLPENPLHFIKQNVLSCPVHQRDPDPTPGAASALGVGVVLCVRVFALSSNLIIWLGEEPPSTVTVHLDWTHRNFWPVRQRTNLTVLDKMPH